MQHHRGTVDDVSSPILDRVTHRPWALPARPWAGFMRWRELAFLHWRVDPAIVRPLVPEGLELETFDAAAWIGVVPFLMDDARVRFSPALPGTSTFPELNVRTYVRRGARFGVWFFSLDAASRVAVRGARFLYNLPYFDAEMSIETEGEGVRYTSRRVHSGAPAAEFRASYAPTGPVYTAQPGTLDYFLAERYCLFAQSRGGELGALDVHHYPWPLQQATARIEVNTMARASGLALTGEPIVHFARSLDVLAWNRVPVK